MSMKPDPFDDLVKMLTEEIDAEVMKKVLEDEEAKIWTKKMQQPLGDLYPYGGLRPNIDERYIKKIENKIMEVEHRLHKLEDELVRKNAYIERLCSSLMLIVHDPKKLEQLEGLKEQYEKYIMLGNMIYGDHFADMLKGLR